jgi:pimeloyl-ACP methyl ester carboxylesterase
MRKQPLLLGALVLTAVHGLCGCSATRYEVRATEPPTGEERGTVFSADGAGGFLATSTSLRQAIENEHLPLRVEKVDWSHGWGRVLSDETDYCHARCEGQRLAARVAAYRRACPSAALYLVGHSAGCAVVLAAVESLPAGTVDRVVLLAPALSADYDLRPALGGVRCSVDVFCSQRDWFYLGLGTTVIGTTDRRWNAASGRVGFRLSGQSPEDVALYAKLRQHPWHPCLAWTGNLGGHYGAYQPAFLRAYVLPLFQAGIPPTACPRSSASVNP